MKRVSLQDLVGRTIVKVNDDACNSLTIETDDGKEFMLEVECIDSRSSLYGLVAYSREENEEEEEEEEMEEQECFSRW